MKPNIFKIATKELSQDAFFAWLLQWADGRMKVLDKDLHQCAVDFVLSLIRKQVDYKADLVNVCAGRQWGHIDIWAIINDEIFLVIEDKIDTLKHSDQLCRYKEKALAICKNKGFKNLVCIYLKTGNEAGSSLEQNACDGFAIYTRKDLMDFFNGHNNIQNDIYVDFVESLSCIENETSSFSHLAIKDWTWKSWEGFYQFLESEINVNGWEYVSNPAGGFLGLWWHFQRWNDYVVYLQIEQGNLCIKIGEVYADKSNVRNEWYKVVKDSARKNSIKELHKPKRFGCGSYMTVAVVERKDWLGGEEEVVDLERVLLILKKYEVFLSKTVQEYIESQKDNRLISQ